MLLPPRLGRDVREVLLALSRRFLSLRLSSITDPSLANGLAGIALVNASLHDLFPGVGHDARARRALERAVERIGTTGHGPSLFQGFTGVAWAFERLAGDASVPAEDDPIAVVDTVLLGALARSKWVTSPYDLVDGLVGIGVYALERMPRPSAERLLRLVVERLKERAPHRRQPADLGVAHGIPGVIAFLGRSLAKTVDPQTKRHARALLESLVPWLLARELPRGVRSGRFAHSVGTEIQARPARLGWCYGDAGIAVALLVAADAAREPRWRKIALRVALAAASRTEETAGVEDCALCHGAAGLAHVFHRIHEMTADARFVRATRAWTARALATPVPAAPGLLSGAGGVTLALAAASKPSSARLGWDRVLLLS